MRGGPQGWRLRADGQVFPWRLAAANQGGVERDAPAPGGPWLHLRLCGVAANTYWSQTSFDVVPGAAAPVSRISRFRAGASPTTSAGRTSRRWSRPSKRVARGSMRGARRGEGGPPARVSPPSRTMVRLERVDHVEKVKAPEIGVVAVERQDTVLPEQGRQMRVGHQVAADRKRSRHPPVDIPEPLRL